MTAYFDDDQRLLVASALDAQIPGAAALGAVDYVEQLLTALDHDPPRLWAAPGRWAGNGLRWLTIGPWERHAWTIRLEELKSLYQRVVDGDQQPDDARALHTHACEAVYGDPAYGGNRGSGGWQRIAFPEPLFPPARSDR
ncbi:MAG: hypothetical protein WD691_10330 [Acidimicrobiales bacterium]